jgi:hypothetical protein
MVQDLLLYNLFSLPERICLRYNFCIFPFPDPLRQQVNLLSYNWGLFLCKFGSDDLLWLKSEERFLAWKGRSDDWPCWGAGIRVGMVSYRPLRIRALGFLSCLY